MWYWFATIMDQESLNKWFNRDKKVKVLNIQLGRFYMHLFFIFTRSNGIDASASFQGQKRRWFVTSMPESNWWWFRVCDGWASLTRDYNAIFLLLPSCIWNAQYLPITFFSYDPSRSPHLVHHPRRSLFLAVFGALVLLCMVADWSTLPYFQETVQTHIARTCFELCQPSFSWPDSLAPVWSSLNLVWTHLCLKCPWKWLHANVSPLTSYRFCFVFCCTVSVSEIWAYANNATMNWNFPGLVCRSQLKGLELKTNVRLCNVHNEFGLQIYY